MVQTITNGDIATINKLRESVMKRRAYGITQRDIAVLMNCKTNDISQLEHFSSYLDTGVTKFIEIYCETVSKHIEERITNHA